MASRTTGLGQRSWAWPRVDPRFVLAVALLAVGVVAGMAVVREARITEPLVVAARPIPPGHVLTADDLALAEARLEGPPAALAIAGADLASLLGQTAADGIAAGALVLTSDLGAAPAIGAGEVGLTVPVAADSVSLLRRGDVVTVLGTTAPGRPESETSVLLERATVYAVGADAARVGLGADDEELRITDITIVVPRERAEVLGDALVNGRITLALAPEEPGP